MNPFVIVYLLSKDLIYTLLEPEPITFYRKQTATECYKILSNPTQGVV